VRWAPRLHHGDAREDEGYNRREGKPLEAGSWQKDGSRKNDWEAKKNAQWEKDWDNSGDWYDWNITSRVHEEWQPEELDVQPPAKSSQRRQAKAESPAPSSSTSRSDAMEGDRRGEPQWTPFGYAQSDATISVGDANDSKSTAIDKDAFHRFALGHLLGGKRTGRQRES